MSQSPSKDAYRHLTDHLPPPRLVPLPDYVRYSEADMLIRGEAFYQDMKRRHTTRDFSPEPVPRRFIEPAMLTAGTALSGAHTMGLVTLTHTPNPTGFLRDLLGRGSNERAVLVMPVGYPAEDAKVPDLTRLSADEFIQWNVPANE